MSASHEDLQTFAAQLNRVAGDEALEPDQRVSALRRLRDQILSAQDGAGGDDRYTTLLGQADTYMADNELQREALAMERQLDGATARENADIRDHLVADGAFTDEELDAAGWPSHDGLDAATADGSLEEAAAGSFKQARRVG